MSFCGFTRTVAAAGALLCAWPVLAITSNPLVRMYGDDLMFLLSFDDGTSQPDVGMSESPRHLTCETGEGGVIGRCMTAGSLRFRNGLGSPVVDLTRPGSLIVWVKMCRMPDPATKEPGQPFIAWDMGVNKRLILQKSPDVNWGFGNVRLHYRGGGQGARYVRYVDFPLSVTTCTPGVWRMLVVVWTADKFGLSLDGEPVRETVCGFPFSDCALDVFGPALNLSPAQRIFAVDEVAVLSRRLSDAEIKSIHDAFGTSSR